MDQEKGWIRAIVKEVKKNALGPIVTLMIGSETTDAMLDENEVVRKCGTVIKDQECPINNAEKPASKMIKIAFRPSSVKNNAKE